MNQHDAKLYNSVTLLCFQRDSYYSDLFEVEPSQSPVSTWSDLRYMCCLRHYDTFMNLSTNRTVDSRVCVIKHT